MKIIKKIYKKILLLIVVIYAIFTIANQQKVLNQYGQEKVELSKQIENQEQTKEDLTKRKDDVNSLEYIDIISYHKILSAVVFFNSFLCHQRNEQTYLFIFTFLS